MKAYYGLIGVGGYEREVMPVVRAALADRVACGESELYFVVEGDTPSKKINGCDLISLKEFEALPRQKFFNIAIANSSARSRIAHECIDAGMTPFSIQASNTVILEGNEIGVGAILAPFVTVTSNAKIGKFFQANIYSCIAHECGIGDFATFAPAVKCNDNVIVEDHAYIGTGAVIKQGHSDKPTIIGAGAVIGMGAVVTKDVSPHTTVAGNPARAMEK